jgi:hypothetical protein
LLLFNRFFVLDKVLFGFAQAAWRLLKLDLAIVEAVVAHQLRVDVLEKLVFGLVDLTWGEGADTDWLNELVVALSLVKGVGALHGGGRLIQGTLELLD